MRGSHRAGLAVLHRLRHPVAGRLIRSRGRTLFQVLSLLAGLTASGCDAPAELQPDQLLVDSLGLGPRDRVFPVRVTHRQGDEVLAPDSLAMDRPGWVDFRTGDGWPRRIFFLTDSLPPGGAEYLDSIGASESPPLVSRGTRWPVSFELAPAGVYPFRVESGGGTGRGVIVVPVR